MKLKTTLWLNIVASAGFALAIGLILAVTSVRTSRANEQRNAFREIFEAISDLGILTHDYVLHRTERAKLQWTAKHGWVTRLVRAQPSSDQEDQQAIRDLSKELQKTEHLFYRLAGRPPGQGPAPAITDAEREAVIGQLLVEAQVMMTTAQQARNRKANEYERVRRRADALVLSLVGANAVFLVANTWLMRRRIGGPIESLHRGTRMVGSGKLDHRVEVTGFEETRELAESFNQMTETLANALQALEHEIANRRTAEAQIARYSHRLERSNRALQDFAYVASHDLQEPLRKIQAFGDRLKAKWAGGLGEEGRDYVERMVAASTRMRSLVEALLAYSRVESHEEPFGPVDLNSVVAEVLPDLEARLVETCGAVDIGELPVLEADLTQMRQLFQNLLSNGLKFHKDGAPPRIRIYARPAKGAREVVVEDNGIGFDPKYAERIFAPFQRLHGRGEYEGTGMGLAICRRIAERHGGTLTAESAPGQGSRFILRLPVREERR